jgi:hypothetical protein
MADKWIGSAIKHPGALTKSAKKHGLSTHQEAEKEAHSSDLKKRGRGALALRFQRGGDLHK